MYISSLIIYKRAAVNELAFYSINNETIWLNIKNLNCS